MSTSSAHFNFGQFVPGFDFLQQMTRMTQPPQPASAGMPSWIAPTVDVNEVERRIQELKTVLFWLEQNSTALKATIQALEVQKLTLSTLQHMHTNMGDLASAMQTMAGWPGSPNPSPSEADVAEPHPSATSATPSPSPMDQAMAQASQWWGSMFQTFQHIAQQAQDDLQQRATSAHAAEAAHADSATSTSSTTQQASTPPTQQAASSAPTQPVKRASAKKTPGTTAVASTTQPSQGTSGTSST